MKKIILTALFFMLLYEDHAQEINFIKDSIVSYIETGMEKWKIPGLGILVIKDGEVLIKRGFGYRDLEHKLPFDIETSFFIASNTKLFTGTMLSNLAYQGRLKLDDRVRKFIPEFQLNNPIHTQQVTLSDLLSHRIGTDEFQGDLTYWNSTLSRKEIMNKMRQMKAEYVFRQDFGYCNSCYMTAGEIGAKITGISWEKYITDSIFMPLGMTHSSALSNDAKKLFPNLAVPYTKDYKGDLAIMPHDKWDNLGPAASIISNLNDMEKWARFQLDSGKVNGKVVFPWEVLEFTRQGRSILSTSLNTEHNMHFLAYGLGLFMSDFNGNQVYWHTGGSSGMVSNFCFVPEKKLGIVIFANNDEQLFFEKLRVQILDHYLGIAYENQSERELPYYRKDVQKEKDRVEKLFARVIKHNSRPNLSAYTGEYTNPQYGKINLNQKGEELEINFEHHPKLKGKLQKLDKGEWLLSFNNVGYGIYATSFKNKDGKPRSFEIRVKDFIEHSVYTFTKK